MIFDLTAIQEFKNFMSELKREENQATINIKKAWVEL